MEPHVTAQRERVHCLDQISGRGQHPATLCWANAEQEGTNPVSSMTQVSLPHNTNHMRISEFMFHRMVPVKQACLELMMQYIGQLAAPPDRENLAVRIVDVGEES